MVEEPFRRASDQQTFSLQAGTQAQDVTESARTRTTDLSEESEHGGHGNPAQIIPDDVPDLVDTMNAMNRSGQIDMDAYAGEPAMDDEDGAESSED